MTLTLEQGFLLWDRIVAKLALGITLEQAEQQSREELFETIQEEMWN